MAPKRETSRTKEYFIRHKEIDKKQHNQTKFH